MKTWRKEDRMTQSDRELMAGGEDQDKKLDGETESQVLVKTKVKRPPLYRVILLNDDYTTQEFVILILRRFFHKPPIEAYQLMRAVHSTGRGVAGVYPHDIAVSKVQQVQNFAKQHSMPLRLTIEADQ